jgi:two-component system sensor histidine kinase PilS (NtrC family)
MKERTLRQRLAAHIAVRLVVATVLLGLALVVQLRDPGAWAINPFFFLIGLTYAVSLGFIGSLRFVDRWPWLTDVHFAIDAVIISVAIMLSGGVESLFTILYVLPIVAAASVQFRRGGLQLATLSSILFIGLVLVQYLYTTDNLDVPFTLPVTALPPVNVAQYTVALNIFGFFAVALLAGSLAERARKGEARLEQATVQIADLQAFNQYVLDNLVSGLATADADGRLLTFNRSAMVITGRSGALPVGEPATAVLQLPEAFAATVSHELSRVRSKRTDFQFRRPDSQVIDLGVSVAALPLPDGSRGYLYTFQDVTDVKRFENSARLQQRLAAVGEMAAGIAHEIRNPLASMSGSMQMLKQELPLSADQAQLMDIVLRESERLNQTIKSFLAYARPQRFEVKHIDLRLIVQETAMLLRNSPEVEERHTIEVRLPEHPVLIDADEGQVRQIIWNLATNGLRAMPERGALTLSARAELSGDQRTSVLVIEDEGVGIAPGEVDAIFQPFRGTFGKGTGLGLAIVHRIVTDYGGQIDVRSRPGHGTTFRVAFPVARQEAGERTPAAMAEGQVR